MLLYIKTINMRSTVTTMLSALAEESADGVMAKVRVSCYPIQFNSFLVAEKKQRLNVHLVYMYNNFISSFQSRTHWTTHTQNLLLPIALLIFVLSPTLLSKKNVNPSFKSDLDTLAENNVVVVVVIFTFKSFTWQEKCMCIRITWLVWGKGKVACCFYCHTLVLFFVYV